jgi:hypothetical protein
MFLVDDVVAVIVISSMISNFIVELAVEGALEYSAETIRSYIFF